MIRLSFVWMLFLFVWGGCSNPLEPVDLPADQKDCKLLLKWDTVLLSDGSWFTTVIGSTVGSDTEMWEYWVRFRLSTTDSTGTEQSVINGGPPPFATGIYHDFRAAPIIYTVKLTRKPVKTESGWTWETIDTAYGTHVAPEIP